MMKFTIVLPLFISIVVEAGSFLRADLDYDGKMEKVVWKPFAKTDAGDYYQLFVYDDNGAMLWKGPQTRNEGSPYFVAALDYGVSMPELLMDIDNDGRAELLIPALQSDVSTTWYHHLKWAGSHFEPMKNAVLEFHFGTHNDRVEWTTHPRQPYTYWASELHKMPNGAIRAQISGYTADDPGQPLIGTALIRPSLLGGAVYRWVQPLHRPTTAEEECTPPDQQGNNTPPPNPSPLPSTPYPDSGYTNASHTIHYRTKLSRRDHYNSRGMRLRSIREVLRQDRANFYKGGGDPGDEPDGFFTSSGKRELFEKIRIIPLGTKLKTLWSRILYGTPWVDIRLKKGIIFIRILD